MSELFSGYDVMRGAFSETFPWINAEREVWIEANVTVIYLLIMNGTVTHDRVQQDLI